LRDIELRFPVLLPSSGSTLPDVSKGLVAHVVAPTLAALYIDPV
jgi:hypothetical protein